MNTERLVASPVCVPGISLDEAMRLFSALGYRKFEAFTGWTEARLDIEADPASCRAVAERHGMQYVSLHLPVVEPGDGKSLRAALDGVAFARDIGASIVIFKASSIDACVAAAGDVLDACERAGLTAVLQNHANTPISTVADYREALSRVDDPRLMGILEVGHFHRVGEDWREGLELLGERVALVHVKDMLGPEPVPFGEGEIDFRELVARLYELGYGGDFVVELEGRAREEPGRYLAEAADFLSNLLQGA